MFIFILPASGLKRLMLTYVSSAVGYTLSTQRLHTYYRPRAWNMEFDLQRSAVIQTSHLMRAFLVQVVSNL